LQPWNRGGEGARRPADVSCETSVRVTSGSPRSLKWLAQNDAVGLDLPAYALGLVEHGVEAVVVGLEHELLRHEADRGAFHAVDVLDGVLHLRGAVRAIEVLEFESLAHGGSPFEPLSWSFIRRCGSCPG